MKNINCADYLKELQNELNTRGGVAYVGYDCFGQLQDTLMLEVIGSNMGVIDGFDGVLLDNFQFAIGDITLNVYERPINTNASGYTVKAFKDFSQAVEDFEYFKSANCVEI